MGATGAAGAPPPAGMTSCLMCGGTTDEVDTCCSLTCVRLAERELQGNASRIRHLGRQVGSADARRVLAERNGRLSSALLRWRPASTDPPVHAVTPSTAARLTADTA
jgi:hypothetical protein